MEFDTKSNVWRWFVLLMSNDLLGHVAGATSFTELADEQVAERSQMGGQLFRADSLQNLIIKRAFSQLPMVVSDWLSEAN